MANLVGAGGRPSGRRSATPEQKAEFFRLVDVERMAPTAAARFLGFSAMSGTTWMRERAKNARIMEELAERDRQAGGEAEEGASTWYNHPRMRRNGGSLGTAEQILAPPKALDQLSLVARCALHESPRGFEIFRRRYLGRKSKPWQKRAVADLLAAEEKARAENLRYYMIANVFPGGGKSTTFTHDYVVWRVQCARSRRRICRAQLGAEAITQSKSYVLAVRTTFETNLKLIEAFGRFKPLKPILWMTTAFTVDYPAGTRRDEKEPTCFAVSMDSAFLGFRCEIAIWDDLVSKKTSRTLEGREQLYAWWVAEAQSRVNPGGLCALIGTRVNRDDLFARLRAWKVIETDDDDEREVERAIYNVFTYPVHDQTLCTEPQSLKRADHVRCLGDPDYYPWRTVLELRTLNPDGFELTYQQNDADLSEQLVHDLWLTGGQDPRTGDVYIGCYDRDRALWQEVPPFALQDYRVAICVDPSPTQYWAVEAWLWDRKNDVDYLVGLERRQMQVSHLLDLRPGTLEYSGMLEDFLLHLRQIKIECYYVIIEENAAQRFMLQYGFIKEWARSRNVTIRGHNTTHDKLGDEHYGIETLGPRYRRGQVRLPLANPASRRLVGYLTKEAMSYPDGETDDCLKCQWFFHFNRETINRKKRGREYTSRDDELSPRLVAARYGKAAW